MFAGPPPAAGGGGARRWRRRAGKAQMDSPKALTMQYMVLFSHRTVQLPARRRHGTQLRDTALSSGTRGLAILTSHAALRHADREGRSDSALQNVSTDD